MCKIQTTLLAFARAAVTAGLLLAPKIAGAAEWKDEATELQRRMLGLIEEQLACIDGRIDALQAPAMRVTNAEQTVYDQWEMNLSVDFEAPSDGVLLLVLKPSRPMTLPVVLDGAADKCQPLFRNPVEGVFACTATIEAGTHRWGLNGNPTEGVDRFDIWSRRVLISNQPMTLPASCKGKGE